MNEKHFSSNSLAKLRNERRIEFLRPEQVVSACIELSNVDVKSMVDIGTGTALFAEYFDKVGVEITGVDDSEIMLQEAEKYVPHGKFVQARADHLPFEDKSFDISVAAFLLHEVEKPEMVIREMQRVTKSDIFIVEWLYREEEMGPPLNHRISSEEMDDLFKQLELTDSGYKILGNVALYYAHLNS